MALPYKELGTHKASYHNTTGVSGNQLGEYEGKAQTQDDLVAAYLSQAPNLIYHTAEQVRAAVLPQAPLTSVRRALSNLYDQGLIEKGEQVIGGYGRPVYTWRYKKGDLCVNSDIQPNAGASIPPLIQVNEKYAIKHCPKSATPFALCKKTKKSEEYPDGWRKIWHFGDMHRLLVGLSNELIANSRHDTSKPVSLHLQQIRRVIKRIEAQL